MVPTGVGYACEEGNLDLPACHQPLQSGECRQPMGRAPNSRRSGRCPSAPAQTLDPSSILDPQALSNPHWPERMSSSWTPDCSCSRVTGTDLTAPRSLLSHQPPPSHPPCKPAGGCSCVGSGPPPFRGCRGRGAGGFPGACPLPTPTSCPLH